QTFMIIAGQAKVKTATTRSESLSVDGSVTVTEPYTMTYTYEEDTEENRRARKVGHLIIGHLISAQSSTIHSVTTDAFGNVTNTWTDQTFVIIAGQSKVKTATTRSETVSVDGSVTVTDPYTMTYSYEEDTIANREARKVGQLIIGHLTDAQSTTIHSVTTDAFGNVTNTWTDQTFMVIAGQAKLKTATTRSETQTIDGSTTVTEPYVMTYTYEEDTEENRQRRKVGHLVVGHLIDAQSTTIHSITTDAFGNVTNTWTDQTFMIIAGQAKVKTATTHSVTESIDGSTTVTEPYVMTYTYEEDTAANREARKVGRLVIGHLIDAQSTTIHSITTDAFGNVTNTWTDQTFMIIAGQAKVKTATTRSESISVDGAITVTEPYTMTYTYTEDSSENRQNHTVGETISAVSSPIRSTTTDAFGNTTQTITNQSFIILAGQAKVKTTQTSSTSYSVDGSVTTTEPYTMTYDYVEDTAANRQEKRVGHLLAASATPIHSITLDSFGNRTDSWTEQTFTVIANQAKVLTADSWSETRSIDGATTITDRYTMTYSYYADTSINRTLRRVGETTAVSAETIHSVTTDAFGNVTETMNDQAFVMIAGQNKLSTTTTSSVTTSVDGSVTVTEPYTMTYTYLEDSAANRAAKIVGRVSGASSTTTQSVTRDAFGNVTISQTNQTFVVVANQAKVKTTTSSSETTSVDGSVTTTLPYSMTYVYEGEELGTNPSKADVSSWLSSHGRIFGQIAGASTETIRSVTIDAFGNATRSWTDQTFTLIAGQAKVASTTAWSESLSVDGSVTVTDPYTTVNDYAKDTPSNREKRIVGHLLKAESSPIRSTTTDAFGTVTQSLTTQTFIVIANQAKLSSSTSSSTTLSVDGSLSETTPYTTVYTYSTEKGKVGHLSSATAGTIHSVSTDAFGNVTESFTSQSFVIIANQAKISTTSTSSVSRSIDGSVTVTDPYTMTYEYTPDTEGHRENLTVGHLLNAQATQIHSTTTDAFGNVTQSWTDQTFIVIANQAKLHTSLTSSSTSSVDGSLTVTQPYVTTYRYAEDTAENRSTRMVGQLIGVTAETIHSQTVDAFGNATETETDQVFIIVAGQSKLKSSTTSSKTNSIDGSVTITDKYTMTYSYEGEDLSSDEIKNSVLSARADGKNPSIGLLADVSDPEVFSVTTDSFGNVTYSLSLQNYAVHKGTGQAKLFSATTTSISQSVDGSETITDPYTTTYEYDAVGKMTRSYISERADTRLSSDQLIIRLAGMGITPSSIVSLLKSRAGSAAQLSPTSSGDIQLSIEGDDGLLQGSVQFGATQKNSDGSYSETVDISATSKDGDLSNLTLTFNYDSSGILRSITGLGNTTSSDENGNIVATATDSKYVLFGKALRVVQENIITGQTSASTQLEEVSDAYTVHYSYTEEGELTGVSLEEKYTAPSGTVYPMHSTTIDAFGNTTESWSTQNFLIIAGQAKVSSVTTETKTLSVDGSISVTFPYTMSYRYVADSPEARKNRNVGLLLSASSTDIRSSSVDA
ncbi:MAG TPA: hypothetical protein PK876_10945, partial [Elusimicrobiota bacterium]|nr:hypothetical protein [Elusimicrobiota bacterium]